MAAAFLTLRIAYGQRIQSVNGYASDASAVAVKLDEAKVAVAGSPDFYTAKAQGTIIDVCFTTDLATPTNIQFLINGVPTGDILDVTAHLVSVVQRPNPSIPVRTGDKIQLMQLA